MSDLTKSICHITTLHPRYDIRIYYKECLELSSLYQITILVADGKGNEEKGGIRILDVGNHEKSRLKRMIFTSNRLYKKALDLDCDIIHFHDSDFLPFGYLLIKRGKKVIYDAHEDLPRQILGKRYIAPLFRGLISKVSEIIENFFSKKFSAIVCATPTIEERFIKLNPKVITVCNFPFQNEFLTAKKWSEKADIICFIGGISKVRGIKELLDSQNYLIVDVELVLAGDVEDDNVAKLIESARKIHKINLLGIVDRIRIKELLNDAKIGLVVVHPAPNHINGFPTKMFEYMAAGLPVIASDFPLWKDIIEKDKCGICVNPHEPQKIADAINTLLLNPDKAIEMGLNGQEMIRSKYNFENESIKLKSLYQDLQLQ